MSVIDRIKSDFAYAVIERCSENSNLRLNGLGTHVVLRGEKVCQDGKMCDCIIFTRDDRIIIGIVELKSKTAHSSEIVEKLTNCSEIALDILEKCSDDCPRFEFYHLVLCKRWRTSEYETITKKSKIIVRGKRYKIITKRREASFSAIISSLK